MKSIGIVRKLDNMGRLVLPIELRRLFNFDKKTPAEFYIENDYIIIIKFDESNRCKSPEDII